MCLKRKGLLEMESGTSMSSSESFDAYKSNFHSIPWILKLPSRPFVSQPVKAWNFNHQNNQKRNLSELMLSEDGKFYQDKFQDIFHDVQPHTVGMIILWSYFLSIDKNYIENVVHQFGKVRNIHERWTGERAARRLKGLLIWYSSAEEAARAVEYYQFRDKFIKAISVDDLMNQMATAEACNSDCDDEPFDLFIETNEVLEGADKASLLGLLQESGAMSYVEWYENFCVTKYRYLTHAALAQISLNGKVHRNLGILKAMVKKTDFVRDVFCDMKKFSIVPMDELFAP